MRNRRLTIGWISVATVVLSVVLRGSAAAGPITLAVDPSIIGGSPTIGFFEFDFSFGNQLNGIQLNGQSISVDFFFADAILARVLNGEGGRSFNALLVLETNAGTFPGFFDDESTGFLLAPDGGPLHAPLAPEWVGRASSSTGDLGIGLFPQLINFDMSGIHYDLTLPSGGHLVTGGHVRLASNRPSQSIHFGTAAQLPERGSSLGLLCFALGCLYLVRRFKAAQTHSLRASNSSRRVSHCG